MLMTKEHMRKWWQSVDWCLIAALFTGWVMRFHFLEASGWGIESDEAIVGLMAKHINEGQAWPIFYYGQYYMGSLEAISVALVFSVLGVSNVALKLTPVLFSMVHIGLVYLLAKRCAGLWAARLAALLTALAPATLVVWSGKPRGGFIELVVLGTACLILASDWLQMRRSGRARLALLGFLLGLGWWTNNQIIFYLVAITGVFFVYYWRHLRWRQGISDGLLSLTFFLLGSAPFWYANLVARPMFPSWGNLGHRAPADKVWDYFAGYFVEALPILLGARHPWEETDIFSQASFVMLAIYGLSMLLFILFAWRSRNTCGWTTTLIVSFALVLPLIFAFSGFGWLSQEPRYLLPLYSVSNVVVAVAVTFLWNFKGGITRGTSILILLAVIILNLYSNYGAGGYEPGEPFVYEGERVSKSHRELYAWLEREKYDHIVTNYWIGYRVAFETGERITFSRFMEPRTLRIKEYERNNWWHGPIYPLVLVPKQATEYSHWLSDLGYNFRWSKVGEYVVIDHVVPMHGRGKKVEVRPEQIETTQRGEWRARLVDGKIDTRWGSGLNQTPGMSVTVNFPDSRVIGSLSIDLGYWTTDRARELFIEGLSPAGEWCVLFSTAGNLKFYEETGRTFDLYFRPQAYRAIRLVQTGKHPVLDWSVAELEFFTVN